MDAISLVLLCKLSLVLDANAPASHRIADNRDQRLALRAAGMWRGFRGSRVSKPGLRQHSDGFWYPKRAFDPLCIGQSADPTCSTDHLSWCRSRYWSYRSSDNTFQPYDGKRRRCVSPFGQ